MRSNLALEKSTERPRSDGLLQTEVDPGAIRELGIGKVELYGAHLGGEFHRLDIISDKPRCAEPTGIFN